MSDVHIGYKHWSMPKENSLPALNEVIPLASPTLGVAVEGSTDAWPGTDVKAELPQFDELYKQKYYIDVFNRGKGKIKYTLKSDKSWIKLSSVKGNTETEQRIFVDIDWKKAPKGKTDGLIQISQGKTTVPVAVKTLKKNVPVSKTPFFGGFSGEFSIPSHQFSNKIAGENAEWIVLPGVGRAEASMGINPTTAPSSTPEKAPKLEYNIFLPEAGLAKVLLGILPTQDINPGRGLRIAVSVDNEDSIIIDARKGYHDEFKEYTAENLKRSKTLRPLPEFDHNYALISRGKPRRTEVFDNQRWLNAKLDVKSPGIHTLKIFMIDPEVVLERIIVNPNDQYPSYLGAPEKIHSNK